MINYETDSDKTNDSNLNLFCIKLVYCMKEKNENLWKFNKSFKHQ